jgi:heterodisulfide reductase subunit A
MRKNAVVVGGGIAGLWTAWELAKLGLSSVIVETAPFLGGHVAQFSCKATETCQRCGACALEDVLQKLNSMEMVSSLVRTSISRMEQTDSGFAVSAHQRPSRIVPERCTDCGDCIQACPQPGALTRSPFTRQLAIDETICRHYTEGSCQACIEACPEAAIDLPAQAEEISLESDAVVIATGFQPFDARHKPRFGYGTVPGVVTALELDKMLRENAWAPGEGMRSVAFIQCVGSRDPRIGRNYCSRVCCGYAMRLARLLKSRVPELEPTMFYMDIQTFDRDFTQRLAEAAREVRLVRSMPAEIRRGSDGRPEIVYHGPEDRRLFESFDLVVLSIGIAPGAMELFGDSLGVGLNADGFLGPDGEDVSTAREGVFVAGTAQGPRSIQDTVSHAIRAAQGTFRFVKGIKSGEGN